MHAAGLSRVLADDEVAVGGEGARGSLAVDLDSAAKLESTRTSLRSEDTTLMGGEVGRGPRDEIKSPWR